MDKKAHELTDASIKELSLVFAQKDGKEWAPRNPEARVLGTKAAPKKRSAVVKAVEALKAYFLGDSDSFDWPVSVEVEDDIDHDGDGAADYNEIATALCRVANDIQSAEYIGDAGARSAAIKAAIDCFISELKVCLGESTAKAGARHSKADLEHLKAMQDAHKEMGAHLDALTSAKGESDDEEDEEDEGESGKAKAKDGDVEYADRGYQDDGKKRYPLDTEEHVRAAASYFGQKKNRDKYSAEQQKKIDAAIAAAEKKFGIGESTDDGKKAGEVDVTAEQIQAMINAAVSKAVATVKAGADDQIAAAKAQAENAKAEAAAAAKAQVDAATAAAAEAKAKADEADATLRAAGLEAAKATATSAAAPAAGPSRLELALKAQLKANPVSPRI